MFDDLYKVGSCSNYKTLNNSKLCLKNKAIAISKYNYGPLDPSLDLKKGIDVLDIKYDRKVLYSDSTNDIFLEDIKNSANYSFWKSYLEIYNFEDNSLCLHNRCGNCASFELSKEKSENDKDLETKGYCHFLKFNSFSFRTCKSWNLKYYLL